MANEAIDSMNEGLTQNHKSYNGEYTTISHSGGSDSFELSSSRASFPSSIFNCTRFN
jgi:hypothetical protein